MKKKKKMYARYLAGFLCATVLSADLMSVGLFSLAAETENVQETELQTQEEMETQEESFEDVSSVFETETSAESVPVSSSENSEMD